MVGGNTKIAAEYESAKLQQATIIRNPHGASVPTMSILTDTANAMVKSGWRVSIFQTERQGHAESLAKEAVASGSTVVFACGGDGTANEVANGLAGSNAVLALIRGGLTNALADEMQVPEDPSDAVGLLTQGARRRIDVGLVNGRRFLLMAGVGLDAGVIRSVSPDAKHSFGKLPFILRGFQALVGSHATPVSLRVDGEVMNADLFWLLLTNLRSYAGLPTINDASVHDGLLDCFLFEGEGPLKTLPAAAKILISGVGEPDEVQARHVRRVDVLTGGLPVHVDGEDIGDSPVSFGIEPLGLKLLLPLTGAPKLFPVKF